MPEGSLGPFRFTRASATIAVGLVLLLLAPTGLAAAVGLVPLPEHGPVRGRIATSTMFASDGSELARLHGEIDRAPVALGKIPVDLRNAVVAIEDRRFWTHRGIDPRGMVRAMLSDVRSKGRLQGGSTISQQLVKNIYFPGQGRTVWRKLREVVLTLGLEGMSAKRKILEAYLNTVYFGRGVYGVQTAAHSYFHKDVWKLNLSQSAYLAGLIHMPAHYDWSLGQAAEEQNDRKDAAIARRNVVLRAMHDMHYITATEEREARRHVLELEPPKQNDNWSHPYFVDAVLREMGALGGSQRLDPRFDFLGKTASERAQAVYGDGLHIYTTLDPRIQDDAERAVAEQLPPGVLPRLSTAVVSVQPRTGYVRALIGGRDYYPAGCESKPIDQLPSACRHAKVNLALGPLAGGSGRQPGSSFKPFVLAAALADGISLKQQIESSPFEYGFKGGQVWKVNNYDGEGGGVMPITEAMVHSVNAAYARIEIQLLGDGDGIKGAHKVASMARRLGVDFPSAAMLRKRCGADYLKYGSCTPADLAPSIAIGAKEVSPLQMAAAYATFAAQGIYATPTTIEKITDASGTVLFQNNPQRHRAISSAVALGVSSVLEQVVQRGTGTNAELSRPVAGKTGTSQAWRDAWFDGYVPQLATSIWVGNPVPIKTYDGTWVVESMTPSNGYGIRIVGGSYPARIFHSYMEPATAPMRVETFPDPPKSLFHEPKDVPGGEFAGASGVDAIIALGRAGKAVRVIHMCPPGGSNGPGLRVWKQEESGNVVTLYVSRAVCR